MSNSHNSILKFNIRMKKLIQTFSFSILIIFIATLFVYIFLELKSYNNVTNYWSSLFETRLIELDYKIDQSKPIDYVNYAVVRYSGEIIETSQENYKNINLKESGLFGKIIKIEQGKSLLIVYPDIFDGIQRIHYIRNTNNSYYIYSFERNSIFPDFIYKELDLIFSLNDVVWYSNNVKWIGYNKVFSPLFMDLGLIYLTFTRSINAFPDAKITILHDFGKQIKYISTIFALFWLIGTVIISRFNRYVSQIEELDKDVKLMINKIENISESIQNTDIEYYQIDARTLKIDYDKLFYEEYKTFAKVLNNLIFDIEKNLLMIKNQHIELKNRLIQSIYVMTKICEFRDYYTSGHQSNVQNLALAISAELNLSNEDKTDIFYASLIFDVGKVYIPSDILNKPSKLNELEYSIIKKHVEFGVEIIKGIDFSESVLKYVSQHHEYLDGTGYPNGLKGDEILLGSRIISVADVFDALISHRTYRSAYSREEAINILRNGQDTKYDRNVIEVLEKLIFNKK